jgi:hypothetical protein
MLHLIITAVLAMLVSSSITTYAQGVNNNNAGKTFFVGFMINAGSDDDSQMSLYITSKHNASGTVTVGSLKYSRKFSVAPNKIITIRLPKDRPSYTVEILTSEQVMKDYAVQISSDSDIVVYGMNHKGYSSDAFLCIPTSLCGRDYYVSSYMNSLNHVQKNTSSCMMIVSTEDSNSILVFPKAKTMSGFDSGNSISVLLDKGDIYQVLSDTTVRGDFTGSRILSTRPVSIFSGHERAEVPIYYSNNNAQSRDHLVEQIPPVDTWGNSAIATPISQADLHGPLRVLSSENDNIVSVNNTVVATLSKGETFEFDQYDKAVFISSTNPILVSQFIKSSSYGTGSLYGDPSFTILPSVEQYDTAYTVMCVEDAAFTENLLILTCSIDAVSSIYLDDILIPSTEYISVESTGYVYATIPVTQGVHLLSSLKKFGVVVCGLGRLDSYSYPGGMLYTKLQASDIEFSNFDTVLACGSYTRELRLTNQNSVDARLTSVTVDELRPSGFSIDATLPLVIAPGGERIITVRFTPPDTGYFSGTISLVFGSPRRDTIRIPLSAFAYKQTLVYRAPAELHMLGNEPILVPIYTETAIAPFGIREYDLMLRYDSDLIEDVDYVLENTHSSYGYIEVSGEAGNRLIHFTSFANYTLAGGKTNDSIPLLKIKFISKNDLTLSDLISTTIQPELILKEAAIADDCLSKTFLGGVIVLDTVCSSPHLVKGVAPQEVYLSAPYPNPSSSLLTVEVGIPKHLQEIPIEVEIYDEIGRKVKSILSTSASIKHEIPTDGLTNGLHVITVKVGEIRKSRYFIISR